MFGGLCKQTIECMLQVGLLFLKVEVPSIFPYSQCYAAIPQPTTRCAPTTTVPLCSFSWIMHYEEPQRRNKLSFATFLEIQSVFSWKLCLAVRYKCSCGGCERPTWPDNMSVFDSAFFGWLPMVWCFNVTVKESWLPVVTEWVCSQSVTFWEAFLAETPTTLAPTVPVGAENVHWSVRCVQRSEMSLLLWPLV